jgi:ketosteroid isomerase-like protein
MSVLIVAILLASIGIAGAQQVPGVTMPTAATCAQAQPIVDQLLAAAAARLEAARVSNNAADMRAAIDALQASLRDARTTLAPCAAVKAEDPHAGHAAAPPMSGADSHTAHETGAASSPAPDLLRRWLETYDAAFIAKNLSGLEAFYHPDVTVYEGAGVNIGWANYRDTHLGPELKSYQGLEYGHRNVAVHMLGEHAAFVTSELFLKANASGKPLDLIGRETLVLEHIDGVWKIRHQQMAVRARALK